MDDWTTSADLEHVERLLAHASGAMPSAALRRRVLANVRTELRGARFGVAWRLAGAVAATIVLCVGISFAAQAAGFPPRPTELGAPVRELAGQIHRLTPDISPEESVRRALLIEIGNQVGSRTPLSESLQKNGCIEGALQ
jgi:hypothetical protein